MGSEPVLVKQKDALFWEGILHACHVFLRFLCEVWLDQITPHRELFVPDYFFATDRTAARAWKSHIFDFLLTGPH